LRNAKVKTQPTTNTNSVSWRAHEKKSEQTWGFSADTTFGQFWSDIGAAKDDIWWYQGIGMNQEAVISVEDEFNKLVQVALSGQENGLGYIYIRRGLDADFISS